MSIDEIKILNNEVSDVNSAESLNDLPWLIFSLCDKTYAIYSLHVTSIIVPPDKITPVPNSPEKYLGIINVRGEVYPVLDMRRLFNMPDIKIQQKEFSDMLDDKEKAIENFVGDVLSAVENDEEFNIDKNTNLSDFENWYNEYSQKLNNASLVLKNIKNPLEDMKKCVNKIANLLDTNIRDEEYDFDMEKLVEELKEDNLADIKSVMRSARTRFSLFYREVLVLLTDGEKNLAIRVDKVIAIDGISHINGEGNMQTVINSGYFIGVAKNERIEDEILIIDERLLINSADVDIVV